MNQSLTDIVRNAIDDGSARLPVFDGNALEIREMVTSNQIDITQLESMVERDPAISSELLRVANSTFYSGLEKVVTIRDAVIRLGARKCADVAMLISQRAQYRVRDRELRELSSTLWKHAYCCAHGAHWLAKRLRAPEIEKQALLAGLFHDAGKLLVLLVIDDIKREGGDAATGLTTPFVLEAMDGLHTEVGGRLLRHWGIPDEYARVAETHHDADFDDNDLLVGVVRLADLACNQQSIGLTPQPELVLASTAEAQALRVPEMTLAELEICIEDAAESA